MSTNAEESSLMKGLLAGHSDNTLVESLCLQRLNGEMRYRNGRLGRCIECPWAGIVCQRPPMNLRPCFKV